MRLKTTLPIAALLALVAVAYAGYRWVHAELDRPLFPDAEPQVLTVEAGSSMRVLADELAARGWLRYPRVWAAFGRYDGRAGAIKAGEYEIAPGTSARALLDQLVEGKVLLHSFTLVEGWNIWQLRAALAEQPALRNESATLDEGIFGRLWLTLDELEQRRASLRTPGGLRCVEDHRAGRHHSDRFISGLWPLQHNVQRILAVAEVL